MTQPSSSEREPIAIVGSACHFAGEVNTPSKLWELLRNPKDVRSEISESRFSTKGFYHPDHSHHGHTNVKHSYLLQEDPTAFDAAFFGINPVEARAMDPQHRMLMETVYEAVEAGGMTIDGLRGSDTAVFAGVMCGDYEAMMLRDLDTAPTYFAVGTSRAVLSNRVSYFFDWHGASVTVDTACSSSLVAVHHAVQALRSGDSRMAVACGANVILGPEMYIIESKVKMLSPDGLGRMWDKDANGYARGDGVAAILLKTLSAAIADGDHIECIIRETGVNQDGATAGLTMPSATAQEALIRSTYKKAGLDIGILSDRPQYFEAHGTGTPAGDPVEAEAISKAFFGGKGAFERGPSDDPLFVGSIKTVLGHTEGTAGVAALLKASLALQHATIPPNLLLNSLSPTVKPFYNDLEILKSARAWPTTSPSGTKRASVNSFGFGGTNAHAILESYNRPARNTSGGDRCFTPFVFSATDNDVLRANLGQFAWYLQKNQDISIKDLLYTLQRRRSTFSCRLSLPASSLSELKDKIVARLDDADQALGIKAIKRTGEASKILGVFTGQGSGSARMAADLIEKSPLAHKIVQDLERHLADLPLDDRPKWSLESELLAQGMNSRIDEATISQPLCTAVQIILVDILRAAQVHFDAVVGHSSGEIAAAYAAGYVSARDAILIAYYRGLQCQHAKSPNGDIKGAMLAVGTTMEDAAELCEMEEFQGRLNVAACNSSSSVTISGDTDAIDELQVILSDENKFNRRLRVDQAYHSRHMYPCFDPYVQSLERAGVTVREPASMQCTWFSSVYDGARVDARMLSNKYWADNMTKPVLFAQALNAATSTGAAFDLAVEVGAHPALKGPASQVIQETTQKQIPYFGTLARGQPDVEALSTCLGLLWSHLSANSMSLDRCEALLSGASDEGKFLSGLPMYQWNHDTKFWSESRRSRNIRLRQQPFHPLLGDVSPDSSAHTLRWKNVLKPSEIPWVEGHQVQGQIVFPAAGYVTSAIEAATSLAGGKSIRLIEVSNIYIHQAIMFDSNNTGVEVLIELSQVNRRSAGVVTAQFTYSAAMGENGADLALAADGQVKVLLGEASTDVLPKRQVAPPHLIPVDSSRLYDFMKSLEYNFSSPFNSLVELNRKLGKARCVAQKAVTEDTASILIHPVDLDASFQSVMLAYSYPGDDQLRLLHLPTSISKVRVNPALLKAAASQNLEFYNVDSNCSDEDRAKPGAGFSGNVSLYAGDSQHAAVQVEKVHFKPVGTQASDDRNVFYQMDWVPSVPNGDVAAKGIPITQYENDLLWVLSRIASYYLRLFDEIVPDDAPIRKESPLCHYLNYARHMTNLLRKGEHKYARAEWLQDTEESVRKEIEDKGVAQNSDVRIMLLVGETMPKVFRGETTMIQHFRESGLLDEYYANGFGTMQSTMWLGNIVKQITSWHPHLNFLEIGAGTGGATKNILKAIDHDFDTYTFTDISSSFFENAAEALSPWKERMIFKVCDAEKDVGGQGFADGAYDVIVAYMVIHATAKLDETMRNLRRLLKPGGILLIGEGASDGPLQAGAGFIFGPLPGWWRGVEEGRDLSPLVNVPQWDEILKNTGFSGIDTMSPPHLLDAFGIIMLATQAVDDRVEIVRTPLLSPNVPLIRQVLIIGGITSEVAQLADGVASKLTSWGSKVHRCKALVDLDKTLASDPQVAVISLSDLEKPVFKDIDAESWFAFRSLFQGQNTMVWLTTGRLGDDPWANMAPGFGRSALHEEEELRIQFIDVPSVQKANAHTIVESLIRLSSTELDQEGVLYTRESEIVEDQEGRQLVPRLRPITAANDRYNSIQRPILSRENGKESIVEIVSEESSYALVKESRYEGRNKTITAPAIEVQTTASTLSALRTPIGHRYLLSGFQPGSSKRCLALVPSVKSVQQIPVNCVISVESSVSGDEVLLGSVAARLIAISLVSPMVSGQHLLVHGATESIAAEIAATASMYGIDVSFIANAGDSYDSSLRYIELPPYSGRSEVMEILPPRISCFANLANDVSENVTTVLSALPRYCQIEDTTTLFAATASSDDSVDSGTMLTDLLDKALQGESMQSPLETTELERLVGEKQTRYPLSIVDWKKTEAVPFRVTRFDLKSLFRTDKTYWLVGLSGALGISLCDWMIDRGVRYLVLTSRNPKIDPAWINEHARNGVMIKIMLCDVTDESAIRAVHQEIVQTLPEIVGVLNGAMVLRDVSVRNMEFDQVTDVIRPKVLGSIHLDRIFYSVNLDFFILLSSINCVIGNVGQANYAAANMGMCGVAANRRKRGLASSVANVGAIIGVGYITQSQRALDVTVAKTHMMHLSEQDFHQIFAEAMEAGNPDSNAGPEISTGLLDVSPKSENIPKWYSDAKFARFIVHQLSSEEDKKGDANTVSLLERLQACKSQQELRSITQQAFAAQLRKTLQLSLDDDDLLGRRGTDLGLDSLVSVDIRSWFLKNFQVSIPVLKIMANDVQMSSLCDLAVEGVPADMVPQMQGNSAPVTSASSSNTSKADTGSPVSDRSHSISTAATTPSRDDPSSAKIDWDFEATPPTLLEKPASTNPPKAQPEVVLLTGCTGLLGHHLLNALLAQPSIRKVVCIAVRKLSERLANKELPPASDRVVYYEGDLTWPSLGLSEQEELSIFDEIDAVIHNGSDTSHLKYYSALRDANVGSTKQLTRLCLRRGIPMHYVSSAGVALFADLDAFPEISCTTTGKEPPADGAHGYMCGKWVSELMLERVNRQHGLRVCIQRPSTIVRAGEDATTEKAEFDWVNALLHYSHQIQAVPRVVHNAGAFDLVYVSSVCDDIIRELLHSTASADAITYFNNVGDEVIPMAGMGEYLSKQKGIARSYDIVSFDEWSLRAIASGLHPAVAALVETFDEPGAAKYPALLKTR